MTMYSTPDAPPPQFYFCNAGTGSLLTCPDGLVFSTETGNCVWPDGSGRTDCKAQSESRRRNQAV